MAAEPDGEAGGAPWAQNCGAATPLASPLSLLPSAFCPLPPPHLPFPSTPRPRALLCPSSSSSLFPLPSSSLFPLLFPLPSSSSSFQHRYSFAVPPF
eukprot:7268212-Pyramimonas_sp.AAC.1